MPKISDLPSISSYADDDELVINDESVSTTKKTTYANLKTNLTNDLLTPDYVEIDGTALSVYTFTGITPEATGWIITLPADGTYLVTANIRSRLDTSTAGRYITLYLYHEGVVITGTERICNYQADTAEQTIDNVPITAIVTGTAGDEIELYGDLSSTSGVTYGRVESDVNGYSSINAVRIK